MTKIFPTLYKKTSTGAIQYWRIAVETNVISTEYGQVGTDNPQLTSDTIKEGKNVGRVNATTILEQALAEAESKYTRQLKKGYVDSIEAAEAGKVNALITGGVNPMLAQSYKKHAKKISFPCYVQPKLDGIRCIAVVEDGVCTLWTRTRKPINSCPHIIEAVESLNMGNVVLDGELYNHAFKDDFEKIVSAVRKDMPSPESALVQYHIYDMVLDKDFDERNSALSYLVMDYYGEHLQFVETYLVTSEDVAREYFAQFLEEGYEGLMFRNSMGGYESKRSYNLQKWKEFDTNEFCVVGIEEGRGKLQGHVGSFVCRAFNGETFNAKMKGSTARLKELFEDHSLWKGKMLTVQYQGTSAYGVPRFPVGIELRDYE